MAETAIDVRNVVKRFGSFTALERLSLSIQDNEFFTLLGPSGCGKTTLLRMIAGFDQVTEGEILLFGEEIENLPPHQRPINMVFQNYALFPHMTIIENVMFGLQMRGKSNAKARSEAQKMLELVQLEQFMDRRPNQLSGGQQQRVALARALAPKPKLLLLDEPLSALDLKLRQAMRFELKEMQHKTGITFIFVTHDQEEALTMSDRIAVMSAGKLQQLGKARDIYEAPANRFVAGFIGETNLLDAEILQVEGERAQCRLAENAVLSCQIATNARAGEKGQISVRPERIHISAQSGDKGILPGVIRENTFIGTAIQTRVQLDHGVELFVKTPNSMAGNQSIFEAGTTVSLTIEEGAARLLTA